jgi:hypothetical protein
MCGGGRGGGGGGAYLSDRRCINSCILRGERVLNFRQLLKVELTLGVRQLVFDSWQDSLVAYRTAQEHTQPAVHRVER